MINQCPHREPEFKQHDEMKPTRTLIRFFVMAAAILYAAVASAHTFQSAGLVSRPTSLPSGAFGAVFSMESGRLAAWQARDSGRVVIYDLSSTPTHMSTINTPDSVFDNPAFGSRVSFSGVGNIFIASPEWHGIKAAFRQKFVVNQGSLALWSISKPCSAESFRASHASLPNGRNQPFSSKTDLNPVPFSLVPSLGYQHPMTGGFTHMTSRILHLLR
jgi:hypothetical protein